MQSATCYPGIISGCDASPGQRAGGGAGDRAHHDPHPHLLPLPRQVRVVPRPIQQQHGEYTTLNLTFSGGKQDIDLNGRYILHRFPFTYIFGCESSPISCNVRKLVS